MTTPDLHSIHTGQQLWEFARANGLRAVADLLRKYVLDGEPDSFCADHTTRAMCRIASKGVEGVRDEDDPRQYIDTKYGVDLYQFMWSSDYKLPEVETRQGCQRDYRPRPVRHGLAHMA